MRRTSVVGIALGLALLGAGGAAADPIDYSVPPNGVWPPGLERPPVITPEWSPIQVPAPEVGPAATVAYPYLAPWFHDAIPVPADRTVEVQGAVRVGLPERSVVLNGHCLFEGADDTGPAQSTTVHVEAGPIAVDLHPTLR